SGSIGEGVGAVQERLGACAVDAIFGAGDSDWKISVDDSGGERLVATQCAAGESFDIRNPEGKRITYGGVSVLLLLRSPLGIGPGFRRLRYAFADAAFDGWRPGSDARQLGAPAGRSRRQMDPGP